jgi:hypothetical protein
LNLFHHHDIRFQSKLGIFNILIMPLYATAFINPTCLKYFFKLQDDIKTSYNYDFCYDISANNTCEFFITKSQNTVFSPPFVRLIYFYYINYLF